MFVLSMKLTRARVAAFAAACGLLLAVTVGGRMRPATASTAGAVATDPVAYLQGMGYEVDPQWTALKEITVPVEEDAAFAAYNALLQAAGYDLTAYKGERIKCYTYTVLNYPGTERVEARVYVHKDRVVAGEIASTAADGFCKGLQPLAPDPSKDKGETHGTTG